MFGLLIHCSCEFILRVFVTNFHARLVVLVFAHFY